MNRSSSGKMYQFQYKLHKEKYKVDRHFRSSNKMECMINI